MKDSTKAGLKIGSDGWLKDEEKNRLKYCTDA